MACVSGPQKAKGTSQGTFVIAVEFVMTSEELEFSISEYLDGNLSADASTALEARLEEDADARALLDEYRRLNAVMRAPVGLPEIGWDQLAGHLSNAVATDADQFEFALSQFANGTLAPEEGSIVESRIQNNFAAQSFLAIENQLTRALRSSDSLPAIRWDRYAAHLSKVVAESAEPKTLKLFPSRWRIGTTQWAIAASLVVASIVGIRGYVSSHRSNPGNQIARSTDPVPVKAVASANHPIDVQIGGLDFPQSGGTVVAEISIGAAPDAANAEIPSFADEIIAHPPRSLIASSSAVEQDSSMMPY
jgi:anti-sigma factor RsiW